MKCIGSIHHIKSKYGRSWVVELYFVLGAEVPLEEICETLQQANVKENHGSRIVLEISKQNIQYLADVYEMIEINSQQWNIDRYSVGETGLEDIFNDFAKEQKSLQKKDESDQPPKRSRFDIIKSKILSPS